MRKIYMDFHFVVDFDDVDYARVVYFGRYYTYAEKAEAHMLRQFGLSNKTLCEEYNIGTPIVFSQCHYYQPARLEDQLVVKIQMHDLSEKGFSIHFEIYKEGNDSKLVSGKTDHRFININNFKSTRIPEDLYTKFSQIQEEVNNQW